LAHQEIGLDIHIHDIVNVLKYEDLSGVILVGHSSSGMVITGVADRARERLSSLIYLDAHVPENGESFLQLLDADNRTGIEDATRTSGEGWRVPPPAAPSDPGVESHPTADLWAWFHPRLVPHPFRTLTQPLRLTRPPDETLSHTFILCAKGRNGEPLEPRMERIHSNPAWTWREIDADHLVIILRRQHGQGTTRNIRCRGVDKHFHFAKFSKNALPRCSDGGGISHITRWKLVPGAMSARPLTQALWRSSDLGVIRISGLRKSRFS
jgi:pimeloyl-ACP methyl ester carboxylesterase